MTWDDADFESDDAFVRFNAHAAAKGRSPLPDPDQVRKQQKEHPEDRPACTCGNQGVCTFCVLRSLEERL